MPSPVQYPLICLTLITLVCGLDNGKYHMDQKYDNGLWRATNYDSGDPYIPPDGIYNWRYQSQDGTYQDHSGEIKQFDPFKGQTSQGSWSYLDPEGHQHQVRYVADNRGYLPQSADIPTPPPIPEAILRSIIWTAQKRGKKLRLNYYL